MNSVKRGYMVSQSIVNSDMDGSHMETLYLEDNFYSCLDEYGLPLYRCSSCKISFIEKYSIKRHIKSHLEEKLMCCTSCGLNFSHKINLKSHEESVHENIKNYSCLVCKQQFYSKHDQRRHLTVNDEARKTEEKGLPEVLGVELTKTGKVNNEQFHVDKHNQIIKNLYDKNIIVKIDNTHSSLSDNVEGNNEEILLGKSVEIPDISVNETIIPILSLKNELPKTKKTVGNSYVFSFNCSKCPEKFLSSKIFRNHICKNTNLLKPIAPKNYINTADIVRKVGNSSLSSVISETHNSKYNVFNVEEKMSIY